MKSIISLLLCCGALGAGALPAAAAGLPRAKPAQVGLSAEKLDAIAPLAQELADKKKTAGAVVLVARNGKVAYLEAFGKMDLASGKAMRTDAIFRIASMTKPVTSAAALILADDGRINLDDPVSKYVPSVKDLRVSSAGASVAPDREITVRDLMRQSSGIDYPDYDTSSGSLADWAAKLAGRPLLFQPGTRFNYSWDADLLARVIEVASGKPLNEFFSERIFKPLGMKDTGFYVPKNKAARFAVTYAAGKDGRLVPDPSRDKLLLGEPGYFSGSGGLVSTAQDYLRFCQMLLNGGELQGRRLLRAETVRRMMTNQLPPEALPMAVNGIKFPQDYGYGLGTGVWMSKTPDTDPKEGEISWTGGASTYFWAAPKPQLVVIVMQQLVPIDISLMKVHPLALAALQDGKN